MMLQPGGIPVAMIHAPVVQVRNSNIAMVALPDETFHDPDCSGRWEWDGARYGRQDVDRFSPSNQLFYQGVILPAGFFKSSS